MIKGYIDEHVVTRRDMTISENAYDGGDAETFFFRDAKTGKRVPVPNEFMRLLEIGEAQTV